MKNKRQFTSINVRTAIIIFFLLIIPVFAAFGQTGEADAEGPEIPTPPFSGTIFVNPDIVTADDPSTFTGLTYVGQDSRRMFDRRVNGRITVDAFLFNAEFDDGLSCEVQVNPEFGSVEAARTEAEKFAWAIGQMPTVLRKDVRTVTIHLGNNPFGGGGNNILIHTGQSERYEQSGILEETLIHEACHTSLDREHSRAPEWMEAQAADGRFISNYARDFPYREDIAESFLLYMAVRYRSDRIPDSLRQTVEENMSARMKYFDSQNFEMYPIE